jgi:hypothetical protein
MPKKKKVLCNANGTCTVRDWRKCKYGDPSLGFGLRCGSQVHPSTCIHAGARKEASESKTAQHVD